METRYRTTTGRAKEWPRSKQWNVAHDCGRCERAATNGVFYEPDEVRHRRDEHGHEFKAIGMSPLDIAMARVGRDVHEQILNSGRR